MTMLASCFQQKGGHGGSSLFTLDEGYLGFLFVLKLNDNTWLNCMGNDFYIPLSSSSGLSAISRHGQSEGQVETNQVASPATYTEEIIDDIRNLVTDISCEKGQIRKMKEAQESILQEIEKLAAEAYSIFRSSIPTFSEKVVVEAEELVPAAKITSGTGSGFEILCQGFNWESHKSGRWYIELREKVAELSSLGFTVVWLPPPTDSVSPEGYMPNDLYNLNSREEIRYDGWRLDFVRGFWGGYVKDYIEASVPYFAVGEYWDSLNYTYGDMDHNEDAHRQRIVDWINDTNGTAAAFDVTTKGILHAALERCEYWRLSDQKGRPPGVVGWWPSRAVTFIENHDTGSTQGHWRFPGGKEMQGYAYILTHSGTPAVFYDHIFSHMKSEISELISLRNRNKIHCRSTIKITKAERDVYAAVIEEKVAMKIGPGHYEPPSGPERWSLAIEGRDYKVWEAS